MKDVYTICFYGGLILAITLFLVSVILFVVLKIPRVFGELSGRTAKKLIKENQAKKGKVSTGNAVSKQEQDKYYNAKSGKITIRDAVDVNPESKSERLRKTTAEGTEKLAKFHNIGDDFEAITAEIKVSDEEETGVLTADDTLDKTAVMYTDQSNISDSKETSADDANVLEEDESEKETSILAEENTHENAFEEDPDEAETEVLSVDEEEDPDEAETEVLSVDTEEDPDEAETEVLSTETEEDPDEAETEVLSAEDSGEEETAVLADEVANDTIKSEIPTINIAEESTSVLSTEELKSGIRVIYNMISVNTDESL